MTLRSCDAHMCRCFVLCVLVTVSVVGCRAQQAACPAVELVCYGGMHETVGQKQHQGRIQLAKIVSRPHFYGVGALEGLQGEIAIVDSMVTLTGVTPEGELEELQYDGMQAALLVGQSIDDWMSVKFDESVSHEQFDRAIATAATGAGLDVSVPFVFMIKGEFTDVRLHVLNGACPMRARMKKIDLPPHERPFELEAETIPGTLVGIYAADSVGKLTHPDTSTHAHLVFLDPKTGKRVTGHLEQIGLAPGAEVKLPAARAQRVASAF